MASEPAIVDPVAMCFDAKGRMFVCEMRGYPNGGVGTGKETRGKIKLLKTRTATASSRLPPSSRRGFASRWASRRTRTGSSSRSRPDLLYLEDTDGDGKADKTTVLYTGFNLANIQQMVNGLQWGLDNWVYGVAGSDGGTVHSAQKPEHRRCSLRHAAFGSNPACPAASNRPAAAGSTASPPTITSAGSPPPTASTSGRSSCRRCWLLVAVNQCW